MRYKKLNSAKLTVLQLLHFSLNDNIVSKCHGNFLVLKTFSDECVPMC